jgi:hypothetical protein
MERPGYLCDEDSDMALASPIREADARDSERDQLSLPDLDDTTAVEELTSIVNSSLVANTILNTASNPVSPGPSSPPLEQSKGPDFVPPTRPSSTPFPNSEPRDSICCLSSADYDADMLQDVDDVPLLISDAHPPPTATAAFNKLPSEIHESILDHLFGFRVSASSKSSMALTSVTKSIGTMLRHSRRREVSDLTFVSKRWKDLVQARLYRHIKIKGTILSLNEASRFLDERPRLARYVKHLEVWFPVFQPRYGLTAASAAQALPTTTQDGLGATSYVLPSNNAALRDVFEFASEQLTGVCIVTLEGGDRRKAPKVLNSGRVTGLQSKMVPQIKTVQTLVTKGQWNLMRDNDDIGFVMNAFPNLVEWHGTYSKPKSKSYLSMAHYLPHMPGNIKKLSLSLEGDYKRELATPLYYLKVCHQVHFCHKLAEVAPRLESFTYTGRVCKAFFDKLAARANPRLLNLKVINLTVKNTCRPLTELNDSGSGIQDCVFIQSFETLVLAGIRSLEKLPSVEYMRIRHVDLGRLSSHADCSLFSNLLNRLSMHATEPVLHIQERPLQRCVERRHSQGDAPGAANGHVRVPQR